MATIYSNRNDNTGSHTSVDPNATATWAGSIVPATSDTVYVVGCRTQTNQAAIAKWTGTITITVGSTSNFASAGFFYTVTSYGQIIKVTYTGITSTTFTGCAVDESDGYHVWDNGGTISNNTYIHNPAYVISVNAGQTFECDLLYIQEGGWININGGTLKINQGIYVRDGRLTSTAGAGQIVISRPAGTAAASTVGFLTQENYMLSVVDLDGGETRSYGVLTANTTPDSTAVSVTMSQGSFVEGDEVAIYNVKDTRRWNKGYTGYRDYTASFKDMDEGFDVAGVSGNTVYLATRNGARGVIKDSTTLGSQKVLNVDNTTSNFVAGDKIIVNNKSYTIDAVEDSSYTLYDYDFTSPTTSLSDFWVNDSTHIYSAGWSIASGVGLQNNTTSYREFVHKFCWRRDVIVEAYMSPYSNFYNGTLGTANFGILTAYDPSCRWGHRGYDLTKSDILRIDKASNILTFYIRTVSNYFNDRPSYVSDFNNAIVGPATYRVTTSKNFTYVHVNGMELTKEWRRDGSFKGLVGLYINGINSMTCQRLTIKAPTQLLYVTTTDSFTNNSVVYRSAIESPHYVGDRIVKISSINTGNGSHGDLAFAFRGQNGSGEWPQATQVNGVNTTNSSLPYVHNHDMNPDYYYGLNTGTAAQSITMDLTYQRTFTHVSFVPRMNDTGGMYGYNGVAVYGSNDGSTWTKLFGPTNDTKKWYGGGGSFNRMAFYPTGTVSYRYVKLETKGDQSASLFNRYVNIGVHDFSEGYTITVNNASDLNIGDKITVMSDSGYSWATREYEAYYAWVSASASDPETYYHGGWLPECTITNKINNKLYLDRPIFWGYVEDADSVTVVKTNRNFSISGTMGPTSAFSDWRWPTITTNGGSSVGRIFQLKNIRLNYIGSYRYSGSTDYTRGLRLYAYDFFNANLIDSCVYMVGPDGGTWNGLYCYAGHSIWRNSVFVGMRSVTMKYNTSYTGSAAFNNKLLGVISTYIQDVELFTFNYNEIASCDTGVNIGNMRLDRNIIPFPNEIRRNFVKGSSYAAFLLYNESVGARRVPRVKIEYNKIRAMDDYAFVGQAFGAWPIVATDMFSEHSGSRLTRYRNEGPMAQGDTSSDLSYVMTSTNYGRFGYNVTFGTYNTLVADDKNPNVLEVYNSSTDDLYAILGIEMDITEDINFQVEVQFDYQYSARSRMQSDGLNAGRLMCYALQNGTKIQSLYGKIPSTIGDGWYTFKGTFDAFTASEGKAAVYLTRDALNSYIRIKNSSARILTDNPSAIRVIGNTFMLNRVWDQYGEDKDKFPLTYSNGRTINIKGIKL